jgi:hypothetical protein
MDGLEELFTAAEPATETPTGEQTPTAEAQGAQEPATPSQEPQAPAQPAHDETAGLRAALVAERQKRQDYERQLAEARAPKAEAKPPETPPDFWEDPEGALKRMSEGFEEKLARERVRISETLLAGQHEDFAEVRDHFVKIAHANPALAAQMWAADNPAEFAYKTGKAALMIAKVGDPLKLEETLRAEIRAEFDKTVEARVAAALKKRADIPPSLGSMPGGGGVKESAWSGPTPLSDVLPKT